jgi:hypothetical protein
MGAWGTGLWEDDLSCDIQDEWNELMDEGVDHRDGSGGTFLCERSQPSTIFFVVF